MFSQLANIHDPYGEMRGLLRRMDEVFREVDRPLLGTSLVSDAWPVVRLHDAGDVLELSADVPGMTDQDLTIEATEETLTIRGSKKVEIPEGYTAHRRERKAVNFARSFALPCRIDLEQVTASVRDGVLCLRATKVPEAQPKQITVTSG